MKRYEWINEARKHNFEHNMGLAQGTTFIDRLNVKHRNIGVIGRCDIYAAATWTIGKSLLCM
jgi:hypothetical protein